jgi:hypothetical protein
MLGRKPVWIGFAICLVLVIIAVNLSRHTPLARIPLTDGNELRLEYVTYGTRHRIHSPHWLSEWIAEFGRTLPHRRLPGPPQEYTCRTKVPSPVLWFTYFDPKTGKFLAPGPNNILLFTAAVDSKLEYNFGSMSDGQWPMPNYRVPLTSYDRRQSTIRVALSGLGQNTELVLRNPAILSRFPEWQPEPLPQVRHTAHGDVVLQSLEVSRLVFGQHVTADVKVLAHGREVPGMKTWISRMTDAMGNRVDRMRFGQVLPLDQSAWKVQIRVRRNGDYPFVDDAGLTLGPVPMPRAGEVRTFALPEKEAKEGFRMAMLAGPGHFEWSNGTLIRAKPTPSQKYIFWDSSVVGRDLMMDSENPVIACIFDSAKTGTTPAGMRWGRGNQKLVARLRWEGQGCGARVWRLESYTSEHSHRAFELPPFGQGTPPPGTPVFIQLVSEESDVVEFLAAPSKVVNRIVQP